ncbi:hypothetical protein AB1Y20_020171 [Prymnesium parvum]|uniref:Uncharacterized protein n=1 Tax=Prymnesium parvum TaxID=97485 RepID=A0AB34JXD0_PRYPA
MDSRATDRPPAARRISTVATDVVHRICSDQVIIDVQSALKELLENALDAGARRLDIRLKEYGVELLEVADNGAGVAAGNLDALALRHHTSKLVEFDDLQALRSFGFRGEALNSLARLGTLSVSTRTKDDKVGTALTFHPDGSVATRKAVPRDVGTCVGVATLFAPFPVRRRELQRNATSEFRKLLLSLQAYALVCDDVRFSCVNTVRGGGKQVVLQTEGSGGTRAAIAAVFGAKQLQELVPFSATAHEVQASGFISRPRHGEGRRAGDRQFVYVNRRPVDFPKLLRAINEAFRAATAKSECFPFVLLNLQAPPDSFDINVTPDKRTVLLSDEGSLLAMMKTALQAELFGPQMCSFGVQPPLSFARLSDTPMEHSAAEEVVEAGPDGAVRAGPAATSGAAGEGAVGQKRRIREEWGGDAELEGAASEDGAEVEGEGGQPVRADFKRVRADASAAPCVESADWRREVDEMEVIEVEGEEEGEQGAAACSAHGENEGSNGRDGAATTAIPLPEAHPPLESLPPPLAAPPPPVEPAQPPLAVPPHLKPATPPLDAQPLPLEGASPREKGAPPLDAQPVPASAPSRTSETPTPEIVPPPLPPHVAPPPKAQAASQALPSLHAAPPSETDTEAEEDTPVGASAPPAASSASSASMVGMFELLQGVRRTCEADGLGETAELEMACRTFSQQIGTLAANPLRAEASDSTLLSQLTRCATQYLKGWLHRHEAPPRMNATQIEFALAAAGWDWEAEAFDLPHDAAAAAAAASDALAKVADGVGDASPRGRPIGRRTEPPAAAAPLVAGAPLGTRSLPEDLTVSFDLEQAVQQRARLLARTARKPAPAASPCAIAGGRGGSSIPEVGTLERATRLRSSEVEGELRRVLPKTTFKKMEVLGQFNLGFMIARTEKDLFIVDQHAADEKHHFETLQQSTQIHTQRLIAPLHLQLTAADELIVIDHLHVFKQNGFEIEVDSSAPPTQRLRLLALPFSKHTVFGPGDITELVTLIAEAPGQPCKLPKLRSMFAMRACRSSVMIGTALEHSKMKQLISQLADLEQPWNCPHGRPTLRHLVDLSALDNMLAAAEQDDKLRAY